MGYSLSLSLSRCIRNCRLGYLYWINYPINHIFNHSLTHLSGIIESYLNNITQYQIIVLLIRIIDLRLKNNLFFIDPDMDYHCRLFISSNAPVYRHTISEFVMKVIKTSCNDESSSVLNFNFYLTLKYLYVFSRPLKCCSKYFSDSFYKNRTFF